MAEYRITPRLHVCGFLVYDVHKRGLFFWKEMASCHSLGAAQEAVKFLAAPASPVYKSFN